VGGRVKTAASFTVRASEHQSARWKQAADSEGFATVGGWLAETADTYLRELVRAGRAAPLTWFRDRFPVRITDTTVRPEVTREVKVDGMVSGPFGIFRGNGRGIGEPGCSCFSLVHCPTRRVIDSLPLKKSCMALAAELAALRVDWGETDPEKLLGAAPDRGKAQAVIRLFEQLTT
jgi:hypothetical protein